MYNLKRYVRTRNPLIRKIKSKFNNHKYSAKKRGIGFNFTLEEWCQWWEQNLGPDWFVLRGQGKDKYCMGRKGDVGSYHIDNVICISHSENSKMARFGEIQTAEQRLKNSLANRGEGNGRAKLTAVQVTEIYTAEDTISNLARKYKVSRPVIKGVRTGKLWTHVTKEIPCG